VINTWGVTLSPDTPRLTRRGVSRWGAPAPRLTARGRRAYHRSPITNHRSPLIAVAEGVGKAAVSMARAIPCAAHGFFQDFDKSFGLWRPGLRECTAGPFAASFSLSFLRGFGATDRVDDWTVMPIFL